MVRTEVVENGVAVTSEHDTFGLARELIFIHAVVILVQQERDPIRVSRRVATRGVARDRIIKHPADQGVSVTPEPTPDPLHAVPQIGGPCGKSLVCAIQRRKLGQRIVHVFLQGDRDSLLVTGFEQDQRRVLKVLVEGAGDMTAPIFRLSSSTRKGRLPAATCFSSAIDNAFSKSICDGCGCG